MKIIPTILLLLPLVARADCMGTGYVAGSEVPKFTLSLVEPISSKWREYVRVFPHARNVELVNKQGLDAFLQSVCLVQAEFLGNKINPSSNAVPKETFVVDAPCSLLGAGAVVRLVPYWYCQDSIEETGPDFFKWLGIRNATLTTKERF
jgi:hypothetical protein